jgi:predicted secreted protein
MIDGQLYFEAHLPLEDDEQSPETRLQNIFASRDAFGDESIQIAAQAVAAEASGVPVPLLSTGAAYVHQDARLVRNTVERDPNAPTLAEVRALLDEPELTD